MKHIARTHVGEVVVDVLLSTYYDGTPAILLNREDNGEAYGTLTMHLVDCDPQPRCAWAKYWGSYTQAVCSLEDHKIWTRTGRTYPLAQGELVECLLLQL